MFRLKNAISPPCVAGDAIPPKLEAGAASTETLIQDLEAQEATPPLSSAPTTSLPDTVNWIRELNNSHVTSTRHSRASSVVSTRTKFSTTTLQDDARSIDINVAGQYFRISRDGSRIRADPPPPYTGPADPCLFPEAPVEYRPAAATRSLAGGISRTAVSRSQGNGDSDDDDSEGEGARTPRSTFALPSDLVSHVGVEFLNLDTVYDVSWSEMDTILAHRSSSQIGAGSGSTDGTVGVSDGIGPSHATLGEGPATPRRGNYRTASSPVSMSTDDTARVHSHRPGGSLEGNEDGPWQLLNNMKGTQVSDTLSLDINSLPSNPASETNTPSSNAEDTLDETDIDLNVPLSMDHENHISLHYARMMRKLDYDHRKALHLKDKELAELREKLHEKDIVLRQQLRAKDFLIDDLKKRLANMEENLDVLLEKARHQVEDLWEGRWKERNAQLLERLRRVEEDAQRKIERIQAEKTPSLEQAMTGSESQQPQKESNAPPEEEAKAQKPQDEKENTPPGVIVKSCDFIGGLKLHLTKP
ncbi:hypothetical protein ABEF95_012703 [Exophiala dermatitidis]